MNKLNQTLCFNTSDLADTLENYQQLRLKVTENQSENNPFPNKQDFLGDQFWDLNSALEEVRFHTSNSPDQNKPIGDFPADLAANLLSFYGQFSRIPENLLEEIGENSIKNELDTVVNTSPTALIRTVLKEYDFNGSYWLEMLDQLKDDAFEEDEQMYCLEKTMLEQLDQLDLIVFAIKELLEKYQLQLTRQEKLKLSKLTREADQLNCWLEENSHEFLETEYWVSAAAEAFSHPGQNLSEDLLPSLHKFQLILSAAAQQKAEYLGEEYDEIKFRQEQISQPILKILPH